MKYFLSIFLLAACYAANGQEDTVSVRIIADPRIEQWTGKPANGPIKKSGKRSGFRVQIYNGNDRKQASQAKVAFMKQFPNVRSYLTYNSPQFRVRVGDYLTRKEALDMFEKLSETFVPCMVVPDMVNAPQHRSQRAPQNSTTDNDGDVE